MGSGLPEAERDTLFGSRGVAIRMMWWGPGMGGAGWFVMILNLLAFWALVVIAGMALVRGFGSRRPSTPYDRSPLDVLDERFARGEIDAEEYRARKEMLRAHDR